jgi:hypothetical protein
MELGYSVSVHGVIDPVVSIPGKDSLPIVTFLADIRFCEDTILAWIDDVLAGGAEGYDWSGDQAFATITRDTTLLESQWVRDAAGVERSETLPTEQLRELVVRWRELRRSLS